MMFLCTNEQSEKKSRNIFLDYYRGIAALCIILYHYTTRYDHLFGHKGKYWFCLPDGNHAIIVFFLLSGYLAISHITKTNAKKYAIGRFFRMYPVYWISIIISFLLTRFFLPSRTVSVKEAILNLTMFQGFFGAGNVDGAYWTLQYEVNFYCLIMLICLIRKQRFIEKLCLIWVALQIVCLITPDILIFNYLRKMNQLYLLGGE